MGTNIRKPNTSMTTSLRTFCPSCPPRELTVDHTFHQAMNAHSLGLLQVMLQMEINNFTAEILSLSNQITILSWERLYSMIIIFPHLCMEKYLFLYKLVAVLDNGCPNFTGQKFVGPNFFFFFLNPQLYNRPAVRVLGKQAAM